MPHLLDAVDPRELLYPANLLTLVRLGLLVPTVRALRTSNTRRAALLYIGGAMLTDVVDGLLARHLGQVSRMGQVLDPLADKLLLNLAVVTLCQRGVLPWWGAVLLLTRDVGILLAALLIYRHTGHLMTSESLGRLTTVVLTAALLLSVADGARSGRPAFGVALVLAALSVVQYGYLAAQILQAHQAHQAHQVHHAAG